MSGCGDVDSVATGVVIGRGQILTVAHVLRGDGPVRVGRLVVAVVAIDWRADLAVLRSVTGGPEPALASAGIGDTVDVLVWRDRRVDALHATVTRTPTIIDETRDGASAAASGSSRDGLVVDIPVRPGDSGAPVLRHGSELVGIVTATAQGDDVTYATGASEVTRLLAAPTEPPVRRGC